MSKLDEIIKPLIAKSRCGFCFNYKCPHIDEAKQQLKDLMLELVDSTALIGPVHPQTSLYQQELRAKINEL